MLTVGLVVEGTHDLIMLEPLIQHELEKKFQTAVTFRRLQPIADATGTFNRGGWSKVVSWCQQHSGGAIETFFTPLFAGVPACDVVIIHLDGDALELTDYLRDKPHGLLNPAPSQRAGALAQLLHHILNLTDNRKARFAFAFPVMQSEAWILGAEMHPMQLESINAKSEFQKTYDKRLHGKLADFYRSRTLSAMAGIAQISGACESYLEFQKSVQELSTQ